MARGGARRKAAKRKGKAVMKAAAEAGDHEAAASSSANKELEVKGANNNKKDGTRDVIDPMAMAMAMAMPAKEIPEKYMRLAGDVLVEISEVAISIWHDTDCYFHGKVSVGLDDHRLFHREKDNPEKFPHFGGELTLTGPQHALQGTDRMEFEVDLWEGERPLIKAFPVWIGLYTVEGHEQLDQLSTIEIRGTDINALAEINYVVYSNAIVATVEMKLNKHSPVAINDFYGSISVLNSKVPDIASRIFNKEEDEPIHVRNGDVIPLARSVIAVPLGAYLEVHAHVPLLSSVGMICEFSARMDRGFSVGKLTGEYGQIEVSIRWENLYDHYTRLDLDVF